MDHMRNRPQRKKKETTVPTAPAPSPDVRVTHGACAGGAPRAGGAPGASSIHDVSDTAATPTVKEEPPPSPAVVEATSYLEALDEKECKLLVEAVSGAQRAQRLHQKRADECRKLKASLKLLYLESPFSRMNRLHWFWEIIFFLETIWSTLFHKHVNVLN